MFQEYATTQGKYTWIMMRKDRISDGYNWSRHLPKIKEASFVQGLNA